MEKRPDFETLASYEEFKKYYWYRKELSGICRRLGIEYRGTKQELNHHIEEYFCGKLAERKDVPRLSKKVSDIELHTPLLDCGFSFLLNQKNILSVGQILSLPAIGQPPSAADNEIPCSFYPGRNLLQIGSTHKPMRHTLHSPISPGIHPAYPAW